MRKWIVGIGCGVGIAFGSAPAGAQSPPSIDSVTSGRHAPSVRYPVMPQAGDFLILVKSYKENKKSAVSAQAMAEELAEYIRSEHRWPAFVEVRNWNEKVQEEQRAKAELDRQRREYEKLNLPEEEMRELRLRIRRDPVYLEYAVLVAPPRGTWKDMEAARKGLEEMHNKWKAPPDNLCDKIVNASTGNDIGSSKVVNPFHTLSFVVRNPTVPHDLAAERAAAEKEELEVLRKINEGQEFNVFKCPKKYTLVVKGYAGNVVVQTNPMTASATEKLFGDREKSLLDGGGRSAEEFAKVLKDPRMNLKMKPYVLHTRTGSYVCLGEFDAINDAAMTAAKARIAELKVSSGAGMGATQFGGLGLLPNPLPYQIPGR